MPHTAPYAHQKARARLNVLWDESRAFLAELAPLAPARTLEALNDTFTRLAHDGGYNAAAHDALDGRHAAGGLSPPIPSPLRPVIRALHDAFLREETRKVDHNRLREVPQHAGRDWRAVCQAPHHLTGMLSCPTGRTS